METSNRTNVSEKEKHWSLKWNISILLFSRWFLCVFPVISIVSTFNNIAPWTKCTRKEEMKKKRTTSISGAVDVNWPLMFMFWHYKQKRKNESEKKKSSQLWNSSRQTMWFDYTMSTESFWIGHKLPLNGNGNLNLATEEHRKTEQPQQNSGNKMQKI